MIKNLGNCFNFIFYFLGVSVFGRSADIVL